MATEGMVLWVRGDKWGVIGMIDQLELLLSRWPEVQVATEQMGC